ncbi:hypothetical protein LS482_12245 [Sinomicrobium kalidii]|nr:hypothetical protein [Sinomicrobium kalidii]UGU14471.1 hypothetical protein LS482_12245 [Sinomicrobium kalidii]
MKKRSLKALKINKQTTSSFAPEMLKGGGPTKGNDSNRDIYGCGDS